MPPGAAAAASQPGARGPAPGVEPAPRRRCAAADQPPPRRRPAAVSPRRLDEEEREEEEVVPPRSRGVRCRGLSTSSTRAPPQSDRSSASVDVASTPAGKRRRRWSRSPSRRTGCERSRRRSKISSWNSATSCHLSRRPDCPACQVEEIAQHSDFSHPFYVTRAVPCMYGVARRLDIWPDNTGCGAVCSRRSDLAACGYPGVSGVRRYYAWTTAGVALGGFHCGAGGASVRGGGGKCMEQALLACDFSSHKKARHR